MKTKYCQQHLRTKLIEEEESGCETCGTFEEAYFYCPKCFEKEEVARNKKLAKTCNWVIRYREDVVIKNKKIIYLPNDLQCILIVPHGGKKLKRGDFAFTNKKGFLEKSKTRKTLFVIK